MTCIFTWLQTGQSDATYFPGQPRLWRDVDGLDEGYASMLVCLCIQTYDAADDMRTANNGCMAEARGQRRADGRHM